jgi:hypothetical protein
LSIASGMRFSIKSQRRHNVLVAPSGTDRSLGTIGRPLITELRRQHDATSEFSGRIPLRNLEDPPEDLLATMAGIVRVAVRIKYVAGSVERLSREQQAHAGLHLLARRAERRAVLHPETRRSQGRGRPKQQAFAELLGPAPPGLRLARREEAQRLLRELIEALHHEADRPCDGVTRTATVAMEARQASAICRAAGGAGRPEALKRWAASDATEAALSLHGGDKFHTECSFS